MKADLLSREKLTFPHTKLCRGDGLPEFSSSFSRVTILDSVANQSPVEFISTESLKMRGKNIGNKIVSGVQKCIPN